MMFKNYDKRSVANIAIYERDPQELLRKQKEESEKLIPELIKLLNFSKEDISFMFYQGKDLYDLDENIFNALSKTDRAITFCLDKLKNVDKKEIVRNYYFLELHKSKENLEAKIFKLLFSINIRYAKLFLIGRIGKDNFSEKDDWVEFEDFNKEIEYNLIDVLDAEKTDYSNSQIKEDLETAEKTEKEFSYMMYKYFGNLIEKIEISYGKFYDYDIKISFIKNIEITFEVKHDTLALLSGNICVEYKNNGSGEPSGISRSKSDFYIYKTFLNKWNTKNLRGKVENRIEWVAIPINKLKRLSLESLFCERKIRPYFIRGFGKLIKKGGQNNNSRMINIVNEELIPFCKTLFIMNRHSVNPADNLCKYSNKNNPNQYFRKGNGNFKEETMEFLGELIDWDNITKDTVEEWNDNVKEYFEDKINNL